MYGIIYKIINSINDKVYIGQTTIFTKENLIKYFNKDHCISKNRTKLYRAIKKYGKENFHIESICSCDSKEWLDLMEDRFILYYDSIKNGYNIRRGGSHGKLSDETKQKLSKSKKGKPNLKMRGNNHPLYGKDSWNKGKKTSKEIRNKISLTAKKRFKNSENHPTTNLTWEDVNTIRMIHKDKKMKVQEIADKYNLSKSGLEKILYNQNWKKRG